MHYLITLVVILILFIMYTNGNENFGSYSIIDNKDGFSSDITNIKKNNMTLTAFLNTCASACGSRSDCQGFVVDKPTTQCWVKKSNTTDPSKTFVSSTTRAIYKKN